MDKSQFDLVANQDQEAVKNTYFRYPKVTPHIKKAREYVEVKTIDCSVKLHKIDEVILYIVARFKWVPAWLAQQWFAIYSINGYARMEQWINVGLVWADTGSTGVFIRPTFFLFEMMDIKETKFVSIPFNLLNHTCAEMQIVFDVMMGNPKSEIWYFIKNSQCLPTYHPLKIEVEDDKGVPIFIEEEYRSSINTAKLKEDQDALIQSIRMKKKFTEEFTNFSLFTLVSSDQSKNGELYTQRPDLVIPALRTATGQPQSWAIEMELSAKMGYRYDKIMQSYKNNLVYGYVLYLCGNNTILERVKKAYKEAGGLGTCKLYVAPWVAPAQRINNYSIEDESAFKTLLRSTLESTKK